MWKSVVYIKAREMQMIKKHKEICVYLCIEYTKIRGQKFILIIIYKWTRIKSLKSFSQGLIKDNGKIGVFISYWRMYK